jgi:hypothetical protein
MERSNTLSDIKALVSSEKEGCFGIEVSEVRDPFIFRFHADARGGNGYGVVATYHY